MTLPNFLGIGAQRAGTTWLHTLLASHPDVYVPTRRKEVHFFDWYYERGIQWYSKFFPPETQANRYEAIGEITPDYLHDPRCPERIAKTLPSAKLIVTLRNPVNRAYSHYSKMVADDNYSGTFEDSLSTHPEIVQRGFYSQQLKRFFRYYKREQVMVLIFERAVADVSETKDALARFLGIDADRFPPTIGTKRVNKSYIPKARALYAIAKETARKLHRWDLDWVVNLAKRFGVKQLFGEKGSLPPMKEETRIHLEKVYEDEIRELELLLQINLDCWRRK